MREASRTCSSDSGDALGARRRRGELEDLERARERRRPLVARRARARSARRSTPSSPRAALEDDDELVLGQRGQLDHRAAREQRGVHLEVRVLGRRADQRHEPVLDRVQHRVLLRLVEAVDLVDEEDRPQRRCRRAGLGRARSRRARRRPGRRRPTAPRTQLPSAPRRCGRSSSSRCRAGRRGSSTAGGPPRSRGAGPSPGRARAAGRPARRARSAAGAPRAARSRPGAPAPLR